MPNINSGVLDGVRRIGARVRDLVIDGGLPGAPLGFRMRGSNTLGSPTTGTYKVRDITTDSSGNIWTCTVAGTPGTWVQLTPAPPYQFFPENYGAKGNGTWLNDGAITASAAILTSPSGKLAGAQPGMVVYIYGAGTSSADYFGTILSVQGAGQVTLSANAGTTVTANGVVFGTDDTVAIQATINAATAYAQASVTRYAEIVSGSKIYMVAGACVGLSGAGTGNSQLVLPYIDSNTSGDNKIVLAFRGSQDPGSMTFAHETVPAFFGTVWCSPRLDGTNNATYGPSSILGGPYDISHDSDFTNLNVIIDGVNCLVATGTVGPTYGGFDLITCAEATIVKASCQTLAVWQSGTAWPQYPSGGPTTNQFTYSLRMPQNANNNLSHIGMFTGLGAGYGAYLSENTIFNELRFNHNFYACEVGTLGGDMSEGLVGQYMLMYNCGHGLFTEGGSHAVRVEIQTVEYNNTGGAIYDTSNTLAGYVGIRYPSEPSYGGFAPTGGVNCRLYDLRQYPGPVASPQAAPSSTSAWVNEYYRDAWITLSTAGGTVTVLTITMASNTVTQNITAGAIQSFFLPAGASYTPTYTGTLTHTVTLA